MTATAPHPHPSCEQTAHLRYRRVGVLAGADIGRAGIHGDALQGVMRSAGRLGLTVVSGIATDESLGSAMFLPDLVERWRVDGLLISYVFQPPERMLDVLDRLEIPSIWLNNKLPYNAVYPDDLGGARLATEYLLKLGHERVAFACFRALGPCHPDYHYSATDRRRGYLDAMRSAGRTPIMLSGGADGIARDRPARVREWLENVERPTAVVCYGIDEASYLRHWAERLGLRVPADLSILVIARGSAQFLDMRMSRVRLPFAEMAQHALELMIERARDPRLHLRSREFPLVLEQGDSSGPPGCEGSAA